MDDVRYERDIYTWLTAMELSQYYFLFKAAGLERIRDVLFLNEPDIITLGVEEPAHVRRLMLGVRHVCVPDKLATDASCSPVWQSGRLIVEIFAFLDYSRLVASTRVNQQFRKVLKTGIRHLTITNPAKLGAPIADVLTQFPSLTRLDGFQIGPKGAISLAQGLKTLTKTLDQGSAIRHLNLSASRIKNEGSKALCEVLGAGGCTQLTRLRLGGNKLQHKGCTFVGRALGIKRHKLLLELDLSSNGFGDPGMVDLCAALADGATPKLERLLLSSVGMGDLGFTELCDTLATRQLAKLQELDVRWNPKIRDPGGKHLVVAVAYKGTPYLKIFRLRGHSMKPKTVTMLVKACDGYFDIAL